MKRKYFWLLISIGCIVIIAILAFLLRNDSQQANLAYDPNPDNIVIYADLRSYPGPPPPDQPCLGQYFPSLRVWGDGLVFLYISKAGLDGPSQWTGNLTPSEIGSALSLLSASGFLSGYTPEIVNQAGQNLRLIVHLKDRSVEYDFQVPSAKVYTQLIDLIKPHLQPVSQMQVYDPRVETLVDGINSCLEKQ